MTETSRTSTRVKSLSSEDQGKLEQFMNLMITHPLLEMVFDEVINTILTPAGANIIMVVGPTGVGKTALKRRTESELRRRVLADTTRNPGHIPYGSLDLPSYEGGRFNWKNYHQRVLKLFDEPHIGYKSGYKPRQISADQDGILTNISRYTTADLSDAVERMLINRGVKALLIDEGGHFMKVAGGQALLDQMDTLKSIADRTGTLHLLFGPYEMLGLAELSPQLDRRTKTIHFPHYKSSSDKDIRAFQSTLKQFQQVLPLPADFNLVDYWQELYAGSLGCIGIVKDWLTSAINDGLRSKERTLSWKHIQRHMAPPTRLSSRLNQIEEGEKRLESDAMSLATLYSRLGLKDELKKSDPTKVRSSSRPGLRLPSRDRVGE